MSKPLRVLVLEDSARDAELVIRELRRAGFDPEWKRVETKVDFLTALDTSPELILSDYSMPHFDGVRAVQLLRERGLDIPFILISGTIGEEAAVEAMKLGATDYLLKDRISRLGSAVERALDEQRLRQERTRAEEARRESEARWRLATTVAGMGTWDRNFLTNRIIWSAEQEQLMGYEPGTFPGTYEAFYELVHPEDRGLMAAAQARALQEAGAYRAELRFRLRDGRMRWGLVLGHLMHDESGQPLRMVGVELDITERKLAEEALRASEQSQRKLSCLLEAERERLLEAQALAKVGSWETDLATLAMTWSAETFRIFETSADRFQPTHEGFLRFVHPEDRNRVDRAFQESLQNPAPCVVQHRLLLADGRTKYAEERWQTFYDDHGKAIRAMGTCQDITERKLGEAALRESEERFRELAETIEEVFWITDPHKRLILYVSPAFEKVWGRSCQGLYDQPHAWLDTVHAEDRERVRHGVTTRQAKSNYDEEYRIVRADGGVRWIHDRAFPVCNAAGQVERIVGVARDITDYRQVEAQFRQSQKMEAIGQLAGGVAHDFNNILAATMMQVEMATMCEGLPAEAKGFLLDIKAGVQRAASLTRQLLAFSRRQVMQRRQLDVNESVTCLGKMLQRILGEDVKLELELHPTPLLIHADAGMLDQVLMNLVVNARDAMPQGGRLSIETTLRLLTAAEVRGNPDASPGRHVCLRVSDTGAGIPPEILPRIFEPFFTTKEADKGTGLGLATVFGIVRQHHGLLKVVSQVGEGTTFEIWLPADRAAMPDTQPAEVRGGVLTGTETILLVEDDHAVRRSTQLLLEHKGYRVLGAGSGPEALAVWDEHDGQIRLLLTDIVMPGGLSGRELAARLQQQQPALKVIFTSGYSVELAGRELTLQSGQNFLQKPCLPVQLFETIRSCLDS